VDQLTILIENNERYDEGKSKMVKEFPLYEQVFRYVEPFGDYMVAKITGTSDGNISNAFGASPGMLSISAEIVIPGLNGFRIGSLFWVDRIPTFYRAFGAFQVISTEEEINAASGGWTTRIYSRFNYLGVKWREAMLSKLGRVV
jgi:hypothetical protein